MPRGALIVTPEFPPKAVGKTASRANRLARILRDLGMLTSVVVHDEMLVGTFVENGLRIARVRNPIRTFYSILTTETFVSTQFVKEGEFIVSNELVDVIFSFEWSTLLSAISLKTVHHLPLVSVMQTLEPFRTSWGKDPLSITIENFEKTFLRKSDLTVTGSKETYDYLIEKYRLDPSKTLAVDLDADYWPLVALSLVRGTQDEGSDD